MESRHFPVIVERDSEGYFIVECPSFKGCRSYGSTLAEAIANIREAIEVCIDDTLETNNDTEFIGVRDIEVAVRA